MGTEITLLTDNVEQFGQDQNRFPNWARLTGKFTIDNSIRLSEFACIRISKRHVLCSDYQFSKRGIDFRYFHTQRLLEVRAQSWRNMPDADFVYDEGSWWVRAIGSSFKSPWIRDWAYAYGALVSFDTTCLETDLLYDGYGRTGLHEVGPVTLTRLGGVQIGTLQYFEPRFTFTDFEHENIIVRRLGRVVEICDKQTGENHFYQYYDQLWYRCFVSHYELIRVQQRSRRLNFFAGCGLAIAATSVLIAMA